MYNNIIDGYVYTCSRADFFLAEWWYGRISLSRSSLSCSVSVRLNVKLSVGSVSGGSWWCEGVVCVTTDDVISYSLLMVTSSVVIESLPEFLQCFTPSWKWCTRERDNSYYTTYIYSYYTYMSVVLKREGWFQLL